MSFAVLAYRYLYLAAWLESLGSLDITSGVQIGEMQVQNLSVLQVPVYDLHDAGGTQYPANGMMRTVCCCQGQLLPFWFILQQARVCHHQAVASFVSNQSAHSCSLLSELRSCLMHTVGFCNYAPTSVHSWACTAKLYVLCFSFDLINQNMLSIYHLQVFCSRSHFSL